MNGGVDIGCKAENIAGSPDPKHISTSYVPCASREYWGVHQTLRVTPGMEAGVANHVWSVEEIVGLLG